MFKPMKGKIFATDMDKGMRKSKGGIILTDDNFKDHGIRPRWLKVCSMGEDVDYVALGEWVLLPHGRWTLGMDLDVGNGVERTWMIDPKEILMISRECPIETTGYTP